MRERAATSIQPQLWVDNPQAALTFYAAAFGATTVHLVGSGDDIVAQLAVGEAAFWIAPTATELKRLSPAAIDGATSRTLLVVDDPDHMLAQAVDAGATQTAAVSDEHGWRLGRIIDPFGHDGRSESRSPPGPRPRPRTAHLAGRERCDATTRFREPFPTYQELAGRLNN